MIPKQRGRERRKMAQRDNDNKKQRESWKAKYDDETQQVGTYVRSEETLKMKNIL